MPAVSDTSPITNLARIGQLELLRKQFPILWIPFAVVGGTVGTSRSGKQEGHIPAAHVLRLAKNKGREFRTIAVLFRRFTEERRGQSRIFDT